MRAVLGAEAVEAYRRGLDGGLEIRRSLATRDDVAALDQNTGEDSVIGLPSFRTSEGVDHAVKRWLGSRTPDQCN